jgi:type IX secretion system PorP/SprF family membrane protein
MMPKYIKYCFLLIAIFFTKVASSQDIHFSQIFETPLLRNPALAGLFSGDIKAQSVYRSQWNSVTNAYHTGSANVEVKLPIGTTNDFITLGTQILYDKSGTVDLTSTHILPALNYHKSLSAERNMYLSFAVMAGMVQRRIDVSKITTNSQYNGTGYDPSLSIRENGLKPSYSYFDGSVGMSFNMQLGENKDNNLFLGAAYHHFNKAKKVSFYSDIKIQATPKWVGNAGIKMSTSDYNFITFEADYSKQGTTQEIVGGLMYSMKLDDPDEPTKLFHAGAYMRLNDAIIPVVKIEASPIAVAVSYDVNISSLKRVSTGRGGFELSVTYQKYLNNNNSSTNAIRCPKF